MVGSISTEAFGCGTPFFIRWVIGVSALPMSIWLHAMSYLRPSSAVDFVRPVTACLVDVYGEELGRGAWAGMEPLLMMRPPRGCWSFMILIASCVQRKGPAGVGSTTAFHFSAVRSAIGMGGAPMPGLLNNTSRRPNSRLVRAKRSRTAAG